MRHINLLQVVIGDAGVAVLYDAEMPGGTVRFSVSATGAGLRFTVADEGIGIPADEVPHLFESFHRASNVGAIPGTGLGLAIVKRIVTAHDAMTGKEVWRFRTIPRPGEPGARRRTLGAAGLLDPR